MTLRLSSASRTAFSARITSCTRAASCASAWVTSTGAATPARTRALFSVIRSCASFSDRRCTSRFSMANTNST